MYYAFDHTYGIDTVEVDDRGKSYLIGNVHVFDNQEDLEAWCIEDPTWASNPTREKIDAKTARRYIRSAVWDVYFDPNNKAPIEELIDAYADIHPEYVHI